MKQDGYMALLNSSLNTRRANIESMPFITYLTTTNKIEGKVAKIQKEKAKREAVKWPQN